MTIRRRALWIWIHAKATSHVISAMKSSCAPNARGELGECPRQIVGQERCRHARERNGVYHRYPPFQITLRNNPVALGRGRLNVPEQHPELLIEEACPTKSIGDAVTQAMAINALIEFEPNCMEIFLKEFRWPTGHKSSRVRLDFWE